MNELKNIKPALVHHLGIWLLLFSGAVIQGCAMGIFLFPHNIPSGGGAGLAILLNYFTGLPLGFALWISNAFFLIFALNYFGFSWTVKTILSVATTSLTVNYITEEILIPEPPLILGILTGSILFGTGVGILIRTGSSSGGMVIPSLMIASFRGWNPGNVIFWINLFIFLLTSIVIDYKIIIYAVICQFISTRVIDFINQLKIPAHQTFALTRRKK